MAAVFPIHYPRSLLRAFGILPVEVWGPPGPYSGRGAEHLQSYVCSIVGNALGFLLSGGLDLADILIVPHTCDSLQGLGSLLVDFVTPRQEVIPLYLPRGESSCSADFLAEELRDTYRRLEGITSGSPSGQDLMECVRREEEADEILAELCLRRTSLLADNAAFYRFIRSREYLPAETFTELAARVLSDSVPNDDAATDSMSRTPVLLSGIVPEPMPLLDTITDLGATVVADDLGCCGRRLYRPGSSDDPFHRMAERILNGPPDPTRGSPIDERIDHLRRLVDRSGARGVVFLTVKFCEPELFDLPDLQKSLGEAGIPSIAIETDLAESVSHRTRTRIDAFLEMIG